MTNNTNGQLTYKVSVRPISSNCNWKKAHCNEEICNFSPLPHWYMSRVLKCRGHCSLIQADKAYQIIKNDNNNNNKDPNEFTKKGILHSHDRISYSIHAKFYDKCSVCPCVGLTHSWKCACFLFTLKRNDEWPKWSNCEYPKQNYFSRMQGPSNNGMNIHIA